MASKGQIKLTLSPDPISKPDFLCIGYQKTGTSWLYEQLKQHPEIWLPPIKELQFHLEGHEIPHFSTLRLLTSKHPHFRRMRTLMQGLARSEWTFQEKIWVMKYLTNPHSQNWYENLFPVDKIGGDISPTYVHLPSHRIADLHRHHPHLKVLLILRNPVERTWSHLKMIALQRNKRIVDFTDEQWVRLAQKKSIGDGDYLPKIKEWQNHFELHIRFYDEIIEAPHVFLSEIYSFLGCQVSHFTNNNLSDRIFEGSKQPIPISLKESLHTMYHSQIEGLYHYTSSKYVKRWLELTD